MGRLANEKTLELNITHELLTGAGIGVVGFTQDQESLVGADVLFPCSIPLVLQYKAAKGGADGSYAVFHVNNNKNKNQHNTLDAIARSGICRAVYVFPLIVSDVFLASNFGHLLDFTCALDADMITGRLNWNNMDHKVTIGANYNFTVQSSEEFKGEGFPARKIADFLSQSKQEVKTEVPISKFIPDIVKRLDKTIQQSQVYGNSEHTIWTIATNQQRNQFGYFALPIRLKGLKENRDEKVTFT